MMITSGIKAQYTMGTTGMMNIPTAEMQQTGTFMIGGNYLPEELNPFKYNSRTARSDTTESAVFLASS